MMMRKKPMQSNGGYNNQHKKPRYPQGGGGDRSQGNSGGHNRPRRNYGASREKYLAQARDALAAGDRVLAENYFQHADHCYRMMVEEGSHRPNYTPPPQQPSQDNDTGNQPEAAMEEFPENTNALPAFLTANYESETKPQEPVIVQNWEE